MKKVLILAMLIPLALMLVNCAGTKPTTKMSEIPEWFQKPPKAADAIYGVGTGSKQTMTLAQQIADSRARQQISSAIETKVSNLIKDFMHQSGAGEDAEALEFSSSVGKQVSNNVLRGCEIEERKFVVEKGGSHRVYSLARYPLNSLISETKNVANRQKAKYTQAMSNISSDELEKEIEKLEAVGE